jgi:hypothetical protein
MKDKKRDEVINNMLDLRMNISEKLDKRHQEVDNIGYYKDFEFKGSGLAINDAYVVKLKDSEKDKPKSRDDEDQQEKIAYEIYDKDNNLVATVDEAGHVEFDEEFLESIREVNEEYYDTLTLDEAEFELPEELGKDDLVLNKEELDEKQTGRELDEISKVIGSKDIDKYSTMKTDQTPKFEKITNKQEIDPNAKVTQSETLADMIPEIKEKGIVKVGVVFSDHSKGQSGRFSFVGIDKDGNLHTIDSLENTQGTTTGQTVTSINSRDGSVVEEEQVAGMVRINGRSRANGQEEMLSVKVGQYGTLEVDYVRADLSEDKENRYFSAPIETNNQRPTTREVRDMMDKTRNPEIEDELTKSEAEIDRDGETEINNIDNTAGNDDLTPDDIIVLEDGTETTLRKEAAKAKVSPEDFTRRYNERGGKTPDEKIENIHEEYEEEYGSPDLEHNH